MEEGTEAAEADVGGGKSRRTTCNDIDMRYPELMRSFSSLRRIAKSYICMC